MNRTTLWGALLLMLLLASSWGALAQTSSSASASSSFGSGEPAEVRLGGFAFEPGSTVALEITRDPMATCLRDPAHVLRVDLLDASGRTIHSEGVDPVVPLNQWIGRIRLLFPDGTPLPVGSYEIHTVTSVGAFIAEIDVVEPSRLARLGEYSATASVCGLSLRVYRLLTELDHASYTHLRVGDRLMILVRGNPTTGYQWDVELLHDFPVLAQDGEIEFRPESPDLVGSGGIFILRYEAVEIGLQRIQLVHHRPWESVPPAQQVDLHVTVQ